MKIIFKSSFAASSIQTFPFIWWKADKWDKSSKLIVTSVIHDEQNQDSAVNNPLLPFQTHITPKYILLPKYLMLNF